MIVYFVEWKWVLSFSELDVITFSVFSFYIMGWLTNVKVLSNTLSFLSWLLSSTLRIENEEMFFADLK